MAKPLAAKRPHRGGLIWVRLAHREHSDELGWSWENPVRVSDRFVIASYEEDVAYPLSFIGSDNIFRWGDEDDKYLEDVVIDWLLVEVPSVKESKERNEGATMQHDIWEKGHTVRELFDQLEEAVNTGYGSRRVMLQTVEEGVTSGTPITGVEANDSYEEEVFWLYGGNEER